MLGVMRSSFQERRCRKHWLNLRCVLKPVGQFGLDELMMSVVATADVSLAAGTHKTSCFLCHRGGEVT